MQRQPWRDGMREVVCLCSRDTCRSGGKCVDAANVPTQEYDVTDAQQLDIKSAALKTARVAA